jgi:hypothetical protein
MVNGTDVVVRGLLSREQTGQMIAGLDIDSLICIKKIEI